MRYLLLVSISIFLLSGCEKDDFTLFLNHDGENFTSPTLPSGTYELAAKFSGSETDEFIGNQLKVVDFYVTSEPQFTRLKIYEGGNGNEPGDVIFSKEVSKDIGDGDWNRIELREPIDITGQEIWISIRVTLADQQQSIGCDAGPGHPDGGYVYLDNTDTWTNYEDWVGESINWNIRGGLE